MRYRAGEKLEIIRFVEGSHLSVKRTLASLGVSRPTFYRWLWWLRALRALGARGPTRWPEPGVESYSGVDSPAGRRAGTGAPGAELA